MRIGPYASLSEWERFAGQIGWPIVTRDKVTVGSPGRAHVVYDAINRRMVRLDAWHPEDGWVHVEMGSAEARMLAAELVFAADRVDNGGCDEHRDNHDDRKDEP